jgi:5-(carboxyamino)imidazole ribonucleotide synthase
MLALAGYPLGFRFKFYDTDSDCPAGQLGHMVCGGFNDIPVMVGFAEEVDVITFEFENVPSGSIEKASEICPVFPSPDVLAVSQDRLLEKQLFKSLGFALPRFAAVGSRSELDAAIALTGLPAVLKSRKLGYDGKGQAVIRTKEDVTSAWNSVGSNQSILEEFIDFDQEISAIGVRSKSGEIKIYPVCHNTHSNGILRQTWVDPSESETPMSTAAKSSLIKLMEHFSYVGVIALEMFVRRGQLLANEMAPRVHNSGHWTIDGAPVSQFENHLRAIADLPLGDVTPNSPAGMVNIIGDLPNIDAIISKSWARLHLYDKEPREGRKLGHVNVTASSKDELMERLGEIGKLMPS